MNVHLYSSTKNGTNLCYEPNIGCKRTGIQNTRISKEYKIIMAGVGLEPTHPRRLVPKTSALDLSATLPVWKNKTVTCVMLI